MSAWASGVTNRERLETTRATVSTGFGVNMNAYRQRDGLFPILVGHFKRASACLYRDLIVEMVVLLGWLEHSD